MGRGGWTGRTVTLKYKLDTYEVFTRAKTFNRWIKTKTELYEAGRELLQSEWPLRIRLIGLRVTKLKDLRKKDDGIAKVRRSSHPQLIPVST
jgi:DNA polymerase kappa